MNADGRSLIWFVDIFIPRSVYMKHQVGLFFTHILKFEVCMLTNCLNGSQRDQITYKCQKPQYKNMSLNKPCDDDSVTATH